MPAGSDPHVAFIGATGRSGSTLLSRLLGSVPGVVSVGELCWIWAYGVIGNRECGCGQPFDVCPFWGEVGQEAYGGWGQVDAERANDLRRSLTRNKRVPELVSKLRPSLARDVDEYAGLMGPLYRAITSVSGDRVIVDNSKQAAVALLTRRTPGIDLSVIHLVRRSHGVAYSWTKHVSRTDNAGNEMRRRGPSRTAVRWTVDNGLFELLGKTGSPRLLVRYEDLVTSPLSQLERILAFLELDPAYASNVVVGPAEVELAADHSVWGNPMRLRTGRETLRPDEAWRSSLGDRDRRAVTALSLLGLARYHYLRD